MLQSMYIKSFTTSSSAGSWQLKQRTSVHIGLVEPFKSVQSRKHYCTFAKSWPIGIIHIEQYPTTAEGFCYTA